jgi:hypothetical protein
MTNEEIKSGNKLICDFMGVKPKMQSPDIYYWNDGPYFYVCETTPEKVMEAIVGYVKYRSSWDSLMPVIRKIISEMGAIIVTQMSKEEVSYKTNITKMYIGIPIDLAWLAVVEYLEWFNTNKK